MNHSIYLVVATDEQGGIGLRGKLPWRLSKEIKFFAQLTKKTENPKHSNMVIMGRRTWESIPEQYRPLPDRKNIIITTQASYMAPRAEVAHSLEAALQLADESIEKIFIIGGGQVFEEMINHPDLTGIYLTKIHKTFNCDTFFPEIPPKFKQQQFLGKDNENNIQFEYLLYKR